jgi:hypothetical protein
MTSVTDNPGPQPPSTGMKGLGAVGAVLVFIAGVQLFVLAGYTDRYFAWTIQPPLTAAFLGAFYWCSLAIIYFGGAGGVWARARPGMPAVVSFTTLTLVTTLLHLDRFHLDSPDPFTLFVTWAWIVVYVTVPPALVALWVRQLRVPGGDPPLTASLPRWYRSVVGIQIAVALALGTVLFVTPQAAAQLWPWTLTPLTARAVSAWLLALALLLAFALWENDWDRFRPTAVSCTVLGVLQLLALARYPGEVDRGGIQSWIYLLIVLSILAVGLYGWRAARRTSWRIP